MSSSKMAFSTTGIFSMGNGIFPVEIYPCKTMGIYLGNTENSGISVEMFSLTIYFNGNNDT